MQFIGNVFGDSLPLALFLILLGVIILLSFLLRLFWKRLLMRFTQSTSTNLDDYIVKATVFPAQLLLIGLGARFLWNLYGDEIQMMVEESQRVEPAFIDAAANHVLFLFLTITLFMLIWRGIFAALEWFETDIAAATESTVDDKIVFTVRKVLKVVFGLLFIMIVADHFKLPFSKVWAAAGIGSLAIALAAQDTFANMISGAIIFIDRPFLVGDRIELGDGTFGDVMDIGLRTTKIQTFDYTIHVLPNAEITKQRITNHTYPDIKFCTAHNIGVAYGSDLGKVRRILHEIVESHPKILSDPPYGLWFMEFGASSLDFILRYWVSDYREMYTILDEVNTAIHDRFKEEGIEIPFPQRDVWMRKS